MALLFLAIFAVATFALSTLVSVIALMLLSVGCADSPMACTNWPFLGLFCAWLAINGLGVFAIWAWIRGFWWRNAAYIGALASFTTIFYIAAHYA